MNLDCIALGLEQTTNGGGSVRNAQVELSPGNIAEGHDLPVTWQCWVGFDELTGLCQLKQFCDTVKTVD